MDADDFGALPRFFPGELFFTNSVRVECESLMESILRQINALIQWVQSWFPTLPPSLQLFLVILAGFLALALILLVLRILWAILTFPFRRWRRRSDPEWQRLARLNALRQQHRWER